MSTKINKSIDPNHIDPGHRGDLDKETFMAWGRLVFGEFGSGSKEAAPPDPKEIARLLRLGKPVPFFVQDWLADLLDAPDDKKIGYDGVSLVLTVDRRAAQKFGTKIRAFQKAFAIQKMMDCGLSLAEAIEKVMPGQREQGYAVWRTAKPFIEYIKAHPERLRMDLEILCRCD